MESTSPETLAKQLTCDDGDDHHPYYEEDDDDSSGYGSLTRMSSARYLMEDDHSDDGGDDARRICMSRLSICNSTRSPLSDDYGDDDQWKTHYESGDADGELSDKKESEKDTGTRTTSDSDIEPRKKPGRDVSDTLDPLRRMRADPLSKPIEAKNYASENDVAEGSLRGSRRRKGGYRARVKKEKVLEKAWEMKKTMMMLMAGGDYIDDCEDGGNDHQSMPSTPKSTGCTYMDMDELKACRDLGFKVDGSSVRSRLSCSTMDTTSSAGTSPIANWRISSPGDNPTDVKARLLVWAHAVASTARLCN
ncbi:hypothetical protein EJ110_NYTH12161 [Nymphaea thermarum]|nr:hypothetical protein EJ110_NYTH12161 [Nymphaea thermarum]